MEQEVSKLAKIVLIIISILLLTGALYAENNTFSNYDSLYLSANYNYIIDSLKVDTYRAKLLKARTLIKVGFFNQARVILDELDDLSIEAAVLYYRMGDYNEVSNIIKSLESNDGFQSDIKKYLVSKLDIYNDTTIDNVLIDTPAIFNSLIYLNNSEFWYQFDDQTHPIKIDSALANLDCVEYSALSCIDKPLFHFLKCRISNYQAEYEVALNHFDDLLKANYIFNMAGEIVSYAIDSLAPNLDTEQTLRLVNSLKRKRYNKEAINLLGKVDSNETTRLVTAWAYYNDKHYSQAAEIFDELINCLDSSIQAEASYGRAVCDYRRGRRFDGVNRLLNFVETYPADKLAPRALFTSGDFYMRSDRSKSIEIFSKLIKDYPQSRYYSRVLYLTGKMYSTDGQNTKAVETFAKYPYDNDTADMFEYWQFKLASQDSILLKNIIDRKHSSFYNYKSRQKLGCDKPDTMLSYDKFLIGFLDRAGKYLDWRVNHKVFNRSEISLADSLFKYGLEYEAGLHLVYLHKQNKNYYRDIELIRKAYNLKLEWAFFEILENFKTSLQRLGYSFSHSTWDRLKYPFLYKALVDYHAKDRTDPYLALSVIRRESRFDPLAVSSVGALGLMQLMPATAAQMAKMDNVPASWLFEPGYNIMLGCKYLRWLDVRLKKNEIIVAAYNAGPAAAKRWKKQSGSDSETYIETIGYDQSRNYTRWVIGDYYWYRYLWPEIINE